MVPIDDQMVWSSARAEGSGATSVSAAFAAPEGRYIELPVSPRDPLVVARVVAMVVLAGLASQFPGGSGVRWAVLAMLVIALIQPLLPLVWGSQRAYRQVLVVLDIAAFPIFVGFEPELFWPAAIITAALVGNHAVLSSTRAFALTAGFAVVVVAGTGAATGTERFEHAVGILAVVCIGLGYQGFDTRASMRASHGDIMHALGAAGGLAHLTDLSAGVVDVMGDTDATVGWTREEWLAMDHREIIHPDDLAGYWQEQSVEPGHLIDRVARIRTSDGRWIWLRDVSRVVMHDNRPHLRGFSIDVTSQQAGLDRVTTEASTDVLTGLRNRRALMIELAARRDAPRHHLVLMDLNRFKDVNDTLGHEAGDALLQVIAKRLARCLRPDDVLARLGGDEFAVVIDGMRDTIDVVAAVDRMAFEVSRPVEVGGVNITTSLAAGIVDGRRTDADETSLLRQADIAMYAAKRSHRISATFDADLETSSDRRAALSVGLVAALESGDLRLHYQPIVDVETGRIVCGEGLARWHHPDYGLLAPAAFLDVVLLSERSGAFTRRMVLDAIGMIGQLNDVGSDITIAVNLPIHTLEDIEFGYWFAQACEDAAVPPSRFVFEITERDIHDSASITHAIDRLAALGVVVSVDDFGAGHATFERLRWRNVSQLKLDRDVLRAVTSERREAEVLRSILDLAQRLDYDVVAEGVETEEQLDMLRGLGCPHAQGYLFARALARDEFVAAVERSASGAQTRLSAMTSNF